MKYNELKEMTFEEWDGKPFYAIVIDEDEQPLFFSDKCRYDGKQEGYLVTGYNNGRWMCKDYSLSWNHAYPLEWNKKPKKRMTYRQLARWMANGNGEYINKHKFICTAIGYDSCKGDEQVESAIKVRKWGSDEWIEPTTDLLEDC